MISTANKIIRQRKARSDRYGYLLIAPYYVFFIVFIIVPILMNIVLSFSNYDFIDISFIGIDNYVRLFKDSLFVLALKNTLIFTVFQLLLSMSLGLVLAVLLNNKLMGIRFFRTGFFTPHVTSMVAVSMIWLWMYEPSHGMFNQMLEAVGIKAQKWLYDPSLAMGSIIFMSVWKSIGYNIVIYLAGLQSIPKNMYEAADVDGANALQKFIHITIPMLQPVTFFLLVTGFINNFNVFEQIQVMTKGGPLNSTTTVVHQIYLRAFSEFQMGYAAAMSIMLLIFVACITALNFRFSKGHDS